MFRIFKRIKELEDKFAELTRLYCELRAEVRRSESDIKAVGDELVRVKAEAVSGENENRDRLISLAIKVAEIEQRFPEYEKAVEQGVDAVWNKAVQSIIDFDPFKHKEPGDE